MGILQWKAVWLQISWSWYNCANSQWPSPLENNEKKQPSSLIFVLGTIVITSDPKWPYHHAGGAWECAGPLPRGLLWVPAPVQWGARSPPGGGWLHLPCHPAPASLHLEKQEARLEEAGIFRRVRLPHLLLLAGHPRHKQPLLLRLPGLRRAVQCL